MSNETQENITHAAAEVPQPEPELPPEAIVEGLRALRARIREVTPMGTEQRRLLVSRSRTPNNVLLASINIIGAADRVAVAVGLPADEVRRIVDEANRWTAVEDELRGMLNGVAGANLIRRQRVSRLAAYAFTVGSQLAQDPAHAELVPHVDEVKRLKRLARRKKVAPAPDASVPTAPTPTTPSSPASGEKTPGGAPTTEHPKV